MAFIGRERELAVLGSALQRASGGELTRVVISGPLGIGISSLLDELQSRLADAPKLVICRGSCHEPRSTIPYAAIGQALGEVLAAASDERLVHIVGPGAYDVGALIPAVAERLAGLGAAATPPALEAPDQRGARVRESLIGVLERLAADGQLCLIIEDVEHSDPGTRDLLSGLLRLSRPLPMTLILAYHTDEIGRGHAALGLLRQVDEADDVERVTVDALGRDDLMALVEARQGDRPTLGFMAAVMEGSRGNPLVAGQLVDAHERLAGVRLSDPFEEIVQAQLEQLDRAQARVVRLLAASRRPLARADLARVRLADGHLQRGALASVAETSLVSEANGGELLVVHRLCAEAIDQACLPAERHELHSALARLLAAEPAEAAWHWARAVRPVEARAAHLAAARAAERLEPGLSALHHYTSALELEAQPAGDVELLAAAAGAADAGDAFRRAATLTEQAIEHLAGGRIERLIGSRSRAEDRNRAARLSEQLGRYRRSSGDLVGARQAFEQALALVSEGDQVTRAWALAALAQDLMLEGRFNDSAARAEEARTVARAAGEPALFELAHATDTLAVDLGYMGELERGLELLDDAFDAARRVGRLDEVMRCYANKTTLLDLDARREQALGVVKEGIAEAGRNGLGLTYGAFLRGNAADILFQLGRWEEAERECRAAMELPPAGLAFVSPILYLGLVLVESYADEEAARLVGRTLLQLEAVPAGQWSSIVQRTAVSLALWRDELDDALHAAEQGWDRVLETTDAAQIATSAATVLEACAAAAERGRLRRDWSGVAEAGALADRVLPVAEERVAHSATPPPSLGARRELELYLATARAHAARVRGRASPATWATLADAWAKVPVPYNAAKARWWQATIALATREKRAEARDALAEAWRIAVGLQARPLLRALSDVAERARIPLAEDGLVTVPMDTGRPLVAVGPGRAREPAGAAGSIAERISGPATAPASGRFGLSPRENAVLLVLAQGRTNREIAERLYISERTVAVHVRRILAKLGVGGRVEAAGLAIRLGLVPDDPSLRPTAGAGRRPDR